MKIFRTTVENQIVIVDQEQYDKIVELSKLNISEIEKLATEKFLSYVKDSGIEMSIIINRADQIHHGVVSELNYDSRGYPISISEEIKYKIVDNMTRYINEHFDNYKSDCADYIKERCSYYKNKINSELIFWKYLSFGLIALSVLIASIFI